MQANPFDGSPTPTNCKVSDNKFPKKTKGPSKSRKSSFEHKPNTNTVQNNYAGHQYNLKNLVPTEIQGIYYNISGKEDSENCCCNSCHCELCIAEQFSLGISNPEVILRPNVATQIPSLSSSSQIKGKNNI